MKGDGTMGKALSEMTLEELWQLFPIRLTEHQPMWGEWYAEEAAFLCERVPQAAEIHHIGSTSVRGIWAKPIIDILVELPERIDMAIVKNALVASGYRCMHEEANRISLNKGYTEQGFAERVFHLHIRRQGDHDELYFRDYLREHDDVAAAYEELKLGLWRQYEHDRDGYTAQKTDFVSRYTREAKQLYGSRYERD